MLVYESKTLGVLSICIESKDEDRIHLTVKCHDYEDRIFDTTSVLIDRKNNVIWIDNEKDGWEELRKVIRDNIIIQDKTKTFPFEFLGLKGEVEHLLSLWNQHVTDPFMKTSEKFPNIFCFFEIEGENKS